MKTIKYLFAFTLLIAGLTSCSTEDDDILPISNPLEGFNLVKTMTANGHAIELYTTGIDFTIGYNEIAIKVKDMGTDSYVENSNLSWLPVMHMTSMMHSCPKSEVSTTNDATISKGFIVFQMPGNATEYWDLKIMYTVNNQDYEVVERIDVLAPSDGMRGVNSFMGTDGSRYVLAMVNPTNPEVKVNDFTAVLYKMENMMSFPMVEDYTITVDPRMPGMGNHSSPNNVDLTYNAATQMYDGRLSLTMTGYWRVNLKLINTIGDVLKGEDITDANPESTLYFDFEF